MKTPQIKEVSSNAYLEGTSPGSETFNLCIRDMAQFYSGLTYGFFLDYPDEFSPEAINYLVSDFVDSIKPLLTYSDFELGTNVKPQEAMSRASWSSLSKSQQAFLEKCVLTKVGEAHIQLQLLD